MDRHQSIREVILEPILERADRALRLLERAVAALETLAARGEMKSAPEDQVLWTVNEVAAFLQCSVSDVYKKADAGRIPRLKLGAKVRFDPEAVRRYARGEALPRAQLVPISRR